MNRLQIALFSSALVLAPLLGMPLDAHARNKTPTVSCPATVPPEVLQAIGQESSLAIQYMSDQYSYYGSIRGGTSPSDPSMVWLSDKLKADRLAIIENKKLFMPFREFIRTNRCTALTLIIKCAEQTAQNQYNKWIRDTHGGKGPRDTLDPQCSKSSSKSVVFRFRYRHLLRSLGR